MSAGLAVRGLRRSTRGGMQVFERRIKPTLASEAHRFTAAKNNYNDTSECGTRGKWTAVRYRGRRLQHEEARSASVVPKERRRSRRKTSEATAIE